MTREEETTAVRSLLHKLQQFRNSFAESVTDDSRDKARILAHTDRIIGKARARLVELGQAASVVPLTAAAPAVLQ